MLHSDFDETQGNVANISNFRAGANAAVAAVKQSLSVVPVLQTGGIPISPEQSPGFVQFNRDTVNTAS